MAYYAGQKVRAAHIPTVTSTTDGCIASANFTLNSFQGRQFGTATEYLCTVDIYIQTDTEIAATSGNFADVACCTLPAGYRPLETINAVIGNGSSTGECIIASTGVVTLRAASDTLADESNLRIHASFIISA